MVFKKAAKGLTGLLGAGAVALGMSGEVRGDTIQFIGYAGLTTNTTPVNLVHESGADEDYIAGEDSTATPLQGTSNNRLISIIPSHELSTDKRDVGSVTDYNVNAETIGATVGQDNYWNFSVIENTGDSFIKKNIFGERYGLDNREDPNNVKDVFDVKYVANNDLEGIGNGWIVSGEVPVSSGLYDQWKIKFFNSADINRDGSADALDYSILTNNLGRTGVNKGSNISAFGDYSDINGDGNVDSTDENLFFQYGGVPSPSTLSLLGIAGAAGAAATGLRRRRRDEGYESLIRE
jgi:hypothetical protein